MANMKIISEKFGEFVISLDDHVYDYIQSFNISWHISKQHRTFYAVGWTKGSAKDRKLIKMHNIIAEKFLNKTFYQKIDHMDNNGCNNLLNNLRICSVSENNRNRRGVNGSLSKYKGVTIRKNKSGLIYEAYITFDHKSIYLGRHTSEISAAIAYNNAAIKYFGEFANLNKIT